MRYTFKVEERATYVQTGTVSVVADSLEEAKFKIITGEYEHHGDNEIDINTESLLETSITEQIDEGDDQDL